MGKVYVFRSTTVPHPKTSRAPRSRRRKRLICSASCDKPTRLLCTPTTPCKAKASGV